MQEQYHDFIYYYQLYKDKIYNYFWYRLNFNRTQAEDLVSEVFLKALDNFDGFDQSRSFQSWIYAIAKNHLINYYRIASREVELDKADQLVTKPWKDIEANMELQKVFQKIKKMEPYHQEVLLCRFVDGLSNREIAELLGKEEGAVRTQISRALEMLKKLYD